MEFALNVTPGPKSTTIEPNVATARMATGKLQETDAMENACPSAA